MKYVQQYYIRQKMATINPYITYDGNCEAAFNFYKSVFGTEFAYIGRFKDMPEDDNCKTSPEEAEKIMHVSLPIGKETILMGSDHPEAAGYPLNSGNNFAVSINTDSPEEANRLFDGLSEGGKVMMPMQETFWGALFGVFVDKFGIQWMVNHDMKKED
jgi:PhnB protein